MVRYPSLLTFVWVVNTNYLSRFWALRGPFRQTVFMKDFRRALDCGGAIGMF